MGSGGLVGFFSKIGMQLVDGKLVPKTAAEAAPAPQALTTPADAATTRQKLLSDTAASSVNSRQTLLGN